MDDFQRGWPYEESIRLRNVTGGIRHWREFQQSARSE